jgi:hypothetical protein
MNAPTGERLSPESLMSGDSCHRAANAEFILLPDVASKVRTGVD